MALTAPVKRGGLGGPRLTAAVLCSRLLAALAGVIGATQWARVPGWHVWDFQRLTEHLGPVGNALAGSAVRWDSIHYIDIAVYGYRSAQDTVFFPLYPLLIKVLGAVVGSNVVAGVLISVASFAVALVLLHRLTSAELNAPAADAAVLLLAFAPLAFYFSAVYTESFFLALAVGTFYAARQQRWVLACLLAAAAAVTRVPGVLLVVPLALLWWRSPRRRARGSALLLCLPVLSLAAFCGYLDHRGFGLLAPINNQRTLHEHSLTGPISTLRHAIGDGISGIGHTLSGGTLVHPTIGSPFSVGFGNLVELIVLMLAIWTLILAFRALPAPYGIFSLLVLILSVWSPSALVPLRSLDRYVLVVFPLWMGAGDWLARHRLLVPVTVLGAGLMAFYAIEFARWSFVA